MSDTRFLLMRRCGGGPLVRVLECRCGRFLFHASNPATCPGCGSRWQLDEETEELVEE